MNMKNAAKQDIDWPRHFEALGKYIAQYGHYDVPVRARYQCVLDDGFSYNDNLGRWLANQKTKLKGTGKPLSQERAALLCKTIGYHEQYKLLFPTK